ncbi:MAG: hypothetical protein HQK76_17915 [Desulfobacterales bacterium]|nr:hypothetical protein [Desulfobacterales bacterium]
MPVISKTKNENDLNTAEIIKPFVKIDEGLDDSEPIVGLEYIESQKKLLFGGGKTSYGDSARPNIGWIDDILSNNAGLWHTGSMTPYDYGAWTIFEIPENWANMYSSGRNLMVGRGREGWGTKMGPSLFAIAPWQDGNPPINNAQLSYTTLLYYGTTISESINGYRSTDTDFYYGGAWITNNEKSAVILLGTRSFGNMWYEHTYIAGHKRHVLIFFNPNDFKEVAQGLKPSYAPQPYALLDITDYLYGIKNNAKGYSARIDRENAFLKDCAYDRKRNNLYITEYNVLGTQKDKPIIHVFKISNSRSFNTLIPIYQLLLLH